VKYNVEEKEIVQDKDQKEEVEIENEFEEEENRFSREELSDDEDIKYLWFSITFRFDVRTTRR